MTDIYEKRIWLKQYPRNYPIDFEPPPVSALDLFEESASNATQSPAIHYFDNTITYGELNSLANYLATGLSDLGVKKDDRVIIHLQNIPQYLISLYAVWKLGGIAVGLNPMYKEKELEFYCNDSGAKVIITMESCYPQVRGLIGKTGLKSIITTSELDFVSSTHPLPNILKASEKRRITETKDLMDFLDKYRGSYPPRVKVTPNDIGYLIYTSGTTGPPKGAMNTHSNIVFCAHIYRMAANINNTDRVLGVAPFFHVTGSVGHLAVASLLGIPVIAFFRFEAGEVLRLVEKWQASMVVAALTVYVALLEHPDFKKRNISSLTKVISGGAPVPQGFVQRFEQACNIYIHNWYGLTETTSPCIITPLGSKSPIDPDTEALSVGLPIPSSVVKVQDPQTGVVLPQGEVGEIVVKGPMVVPGYWNKPEETKSAIKDGWLLTGDVGKMDEDGWFYIVDRKKDLINVSGYKVWPRDVEDVLYQHPAVKEACVIGVPDAYRGETVKAFVTIRESYKEEVIPEELIEFCRQKMAAYKYPRIVEIVSELAKTLSGKLLKRQLREEEAQKIRN
ncbi:MAG: AMP-binding protein [Thermodesulfobacteriota bacterium]|nr:AMP-binding protein [Thermodesulfobacteriota bacterium]